MILILKLSQLIMRFKEQDINGIKSLMIFETFISNNKIERLEHLN